MNVVFYTINCAHSRYFFNIKNVDFFTSDELDPNTFNVNVRVDKLAFLL